MRFRSLRFVSILTMVGVVALGCADDGAQSIAGTTTTVAVAAGDDVADAAPEGGEEPDVGGPASEPDPLVDLPWLDDPSNTYVLVDAREPLGYEAGHIEGAVSVPASSLNDPATPARYQLGSAELVADAIGGAGIGPDATVVLYDDAGSLYASRVFFALRFYGHDDLRILDGGLTAWESDGRGLSTTAPVVEAVDYPPGEAIEELRLVLDDVTQRLGDGDTTFADARSVGEYTGDLVFGADEGGHIPGARNLDYAASIGADDRFLDVDALRELHTDAGLGPEADVVTYCLVGARGSHSWFVMSELLGYPNVALYDGSWAEYGTADGVEIER